VTNGAARQGRQSGVALIIVLWTVVLLMFLVGHIEAAGRDEAQLALNLRRSAALETQADGAIAVAAFHSLDQTAAHWAADGQAHVLRVHNDGFVEQVRIAMIDQSGKINLNTASAPLLQALLTGLGSNPAQAASVAANIVAWRSPEANSQSAVQMAAQYRASGHDLGPPGAPFESLGEVALVQGVSPHLAARLLPYITLYSVGRPNLAFAPAVVKRAMAVQQFGATDDNPHPAGLRVIEITATAFGPDDTRFTRRAIVRLGSQAGGWLRVITWSNPVAPPVAPGA
jgi:general secretion pathway protein K